MRKKLFLLLGILVVSGIVYAAGTVVLSTSVDRRNQEPHNMPVWEYVMTYTMTSSSGTAEIKHALPINGIIQKVVAYSGAATGITATFELAIDDNGDNEIFTAGGPAELATSAWSLNEPVSGTIDIGVAPGYFPTGGTWEVTVTLRGI